MTATTGGGISPHGEITEAVDGAVVSSSVLELQAALEAVGRARAHALLRGDLAAAERLELLGDLIDEELAYAEGIERFGLPQIPYRADEWLPGAAFEPGETIPDEWLAENDAHYRRVALLRSLVVTS
jgi:hypothetical protein